MEANLSKNIRHSQSRESLEGHHQYRLNQLNASAKWAEQLQVT